MHRIAKRSTGKWQSAIYHVITFFSSLLSYNLKEAILESTTVSMVLKQSGLLPKNTSKEQHQERHKAVTGSV